MEPVASQAEVLGLDALAAHSAGSPTEGYALALTIIRLHEMRDSYAELERLNTRLLAWHAAQTTSDDCAVRTRRATEAWQIVLAYALALAALHSEPPSTRSDTLCQSLLKRLADTATPEVAVQRLRLRGLITALAYSEREGNLPIRLQLDAIAAHCIASLPARTLEIGRWWAERALVETFIFHIELRAESSIPALLANTEAALATLPDPITRFKHHRNQFEWARIEKNLPATRSALQAMRDAQIAVGSRCRTLIGVVLRANAVLAISQDDPVGAERFFRDAIAVANEIAAPANQRMSLWSGVAVALTGQDRYADAAIATETAAADAGSKHRAILTVGANLLHARAKWADEFPTAITHLQSAMQAARSVNFVQFMISNPTLAAWVSARALDHGIEPAFVADIISRRSLVPPPDAGPHWPWAIRIRLLGGWSIEGASVNTSGGGKAQQKPIEVIQLLAIAGPRGLDRASLARAVYGSAMFDSPATLNMAISRARRLLGDDSLIDSQGSRIRLDPRRVYVDLWAMNVLQPAAGAAAVWQCRHLFELYAGPLLQGTANAGAHRIAAATTRDRFVGLVTALAAKVPPDEAIALLREAINRERAAEVLYRSLIERLAHQGEAAEAVEVYQQCEIALNRAYGVAPSERTQRLLEAITKNSKSRLAYGNAHIDRDRLSPEVSVRARRTNSDTD